MKILAAVALSVFVASALAGAAAASPMPSHLSELQPAQTPNGAHGLCETYPWACGAQQAAHLVDETGMLAAAREVNLAVNRQVRPQDDAKTYGIAEKWTLPYGNRGDCEDYALMKKKLLIERGVPAERLLLTVVVNRSFIPHAVLTFRAADGDYILDNMTDAMLPWQRTGYTVVKMQSAANQAAWSAVLLGPLASREGGASSNRTASAASPKDEQLASREDAEPFDGGRQNF